MIQIGTGVVAALTAVMLTPLMIDAAAAQGAATEPQVGNFIPMTVNGLLGFIAGWAGCYTWMERTQIKPMKEKLDKFEKMGEALVRKKVLGAEDGIDG